MVSAGARAFREKNQKEKKNSEKHSQTQAHSHMFVCDGMREREPAISSSVESKVGQRA